MSNEPSEASRAAKRGLSPALQKKLCEKWADRLPAIKRGMEEARAELERAGFAPPADLDEWEHLASVVEKDPDPMTLEGVRNEVLAWAERERFRAKLAAEAAAEAAGNPNVAPDGAAAPEAELLPQMLSAPDLARSLKAGPDRVGKILERYRKQHTDCFREVEGARRNEAQLLYRVSDVLTHLKQVLAKGRK
jgi:hypothetical protein